MSLQELMYINGIFTGKDLDQIEVMNPANQEIIGTVPYGGEKEAKEAIDVAYQAFQTWKKTSAYERAGLLKQLHRLILRDKETLAQTMTKEMGKPIVEARGEVDYAASYVEWYAEEAKRIYGETIPALTADKRMQVWKKPVGVVGAITPWNFPLAMITRKMAPALAAGCTVLIKPSRESPFTAIHLMKLVHEAGFPKGVVNLVTGASSAIVGEMMRDSRVRKVSFTGSTAIGKQLIKQSAETVTKLSLELGGHAPFIIFDDANLDKAVEAVIASKFRNAGQTCVCANRLYVQRSIYDRFVERFAEKVGQMRIGDGLEESTEIGPLINEAGLEKVEAQVKDAVKKGAKIVTGGERLERTGLFFAPTVLRDVDPDMEIMQEETFGPVAPVQVFDEDEEAVELANSTPFGLAAYVFTENLSRGIQAIEALDFGIVGWNDGLPSAAQAPFGGMKESGYGREGGREGIEAYLETQYISIGLS